MKRLSEGRWGAVGLLVLLAAAFSEMAIGQGDRAAPQRVIDARTGETRLLKFEVGAPGAPMRDLEAAALTASADAIARYASEFGAAAGSDYSVVGKPFTLTTTAGNTTAVRYRQRLRGVPVYGAELIVHLRGDGALTLVTGKVSSADPSILRTTLRSTRAEAGEAALEYVAAIHGVRATSLTVEDEGLWVYDPALVTPAASEERTGMVWQKVVSSKAGRPIHVVALVDGETTSIRLSFNEIDDSWGHGLQNRGRAGVDSEWGANGAHQQAEAGAPPAGDQSGMPVLATYTAQNRKRLPGRFLCDETAQTCTDGVDSDADRAHDFTRGVYNFYWSTHARDSLDGLGMKLVSSVHVWTELCNAFWTGKQMAYGDGCGASIVVDDVVAHELTHGVTARTSRLINVYESGAINESFSDVWGEFYDLSNGTAEDTPANRWILGEELQPGGFRNMEDPTLHDDPDRVGSPYFWTGAFDQGGVHANSGINNRAASLMADGGTFNGQTIEGLGLVKPLHIYYYVQTMLAGPTTNYNDLSIYLPAACDALIGGAAGITEADCIQVRNAVNATEMARRSPFLPDQADLCPDGQPPDEVLFFDDFEDPVVSKASWKTAALKGKNAWKVSSSSSPLIGLRSMRADDVGGRTKGPVSDSVSEMAHAITDLPNYAYLHFTHKYRWQYEGFDGSVVQYSVDDGENWTTFDNGWMAGERYPGWMHPFTRAAFPGQQAYVGPSFGEGSTRINLMGLAGQNVKIRFFASSDPIYDAGNPDGWWIDDVRIYICNPY